MILEKSGLHYFQDRTCSDRIAQDRVAQDRVAQDRVAQSPEYPGKGTASAVPQGVPDPAASAAEVLVSVRAQTAG